MLAVAPPRSDTFGSSITVQAARQDSAEFKILAMRSENESPWSDFVHLFPKYNQIHSDYISTIIFRYTVISESVVRCSQYTSPFLWTGALQALANELRQDIRSLQSRTVLKHRWWFMMFFRFLCSHSYTDNLMLLKSFLLMVLQTLSISCLNQSKFWNHVVCSDDFRLFLGWC